MSEPKIKDEVIDILVKFGKKLDEQAKAIGCKNCKHSDKILYMQSGEKVPESESDKFYCNCDKMFQMFKDSPDGISMYEAHESEVYFGPDFYCKHYERREEIK